jgi:hypothetical protein
MSLRVSAELDPQGKLLWSRSTVACYEGRNWQVNRLYYFLHKVKMTLLGRSCKWWRLFMWQLLWPDHKEKYCRTRHVCVKKATGVRNLMLKIRFEHFWTLDGLAIRMTWKLSGLLPIFYLLYYFYCSRTMVRWSACRFVSGTVLEFKQYQKNIPVVFCGRLKITEKPETLKITCHVVKTDLTMTSE